MTTLFDFAARYPHQPGHRGADTSIEAAEHIAGSCDLIRAQVLELLRQHPAGLTADECAAMLERSVLSVRPRLTELKALGQIEPSGARRQNASGCSARVMVLCR